MATTFELKPTRQHLGQTRRSLKAEAAAGGSFFNNWKIIERAFKEDRFACALIDGRAVGFTVWSGAAPCYRLEIESVRPDQRGRGIGRRLAEATFDHLRARGGAMVDLECQPRTSEPFWRNLGFLDFHPKIGQHIKPDNLYKIIIADVAPLSDGSCPDGEVIELWAGQPFEAKSQRADWTWRVARKPDSPTLALPIVQPCSGDWRVVWRARHSVLADDKIKHALKGCYAGDLLFIRDLPPPEGGG